MNRNTPNKEPGNGNSPICNPENRPCGGGIARGNFPYIARPCWVSRSFAPRCAPAPGVSVWVRPVHILPQGKTPKKARFRVLLRGLCVWSMFRTEATFRGLSSLFSPISGVSGAFPCFGCSQPCIINGCPFPVPVKVGLQQGIADGAHV